MYTKAEKVKMFDKICDRMMNGESVTRILNDISMSKKTFWDWLKDKDLANQYTRAKDIYAQTIFDECLAISDTQEEGETIIVKTDGGEEIRKGDMIMHRRLKVDTRKWYLSKVLPKVYGEKLDLTTNGEAFNAPTPVVNVYSNSAPPLVDNENAIDNNKDV
jgi:hypothetical protein